MKNNAMEQQGLSDSAVATSVSQEVSDIAYLTLPRDQRSLIECRPIGCKASHRYVCNMALADSRNGGPTF